MTSELSGANQLAVMADLARIAQIHRMAYSRNHFTALLPPEALMRYYSPFLSDGTDIRLALDDDGVVQGFSVQGTGIPEKIAAFKKAGARDILATSLQHPVISGRKFLKAIRSRFARHAPCTPADFLLLSIAVARPMQGAGGALLRKAMATARERGHDTIGLYVNSDNIRAINAYSTAGFRIREIVEGQYYMEAQLEG